MKKILGLGLVAILVMALVGGGTWAYFSDVETSSGNILVAGTLNLGLANTAGTNPTGSVTGTWNISTPSSWAPGNNVTATLYVSNNGTIAMSSVNVTFSYVFTNGTPASVSPLPGGDTDNLTKMISAETVTWGGGAPGGTIQGRTLEQLSTDGSLSLGSLTSGQEKAFYIVWRFNTTATNGCQGDSANVTLTITGTQ